MREREAEEDERRGMRGDLGDSGDRGEEGGGVRDSESEVRSLLSLKGFMRKTTEGCWRG